MPGQSFWNAENVYKLGKLMSTLDRHDGIELSSVIESGYGTPAGGGGDYYDGSPAELAGLAAEGAEIEADLDYEDHLNDLADTLSRASAREQQREHEDEEDRRDRAKGPHRNRPSTEDRLARALDRISRGTYTPAVAAEPAQGDDVTARFSAMAACGVADQYGHCTARYHALDCLHNATQLTDAAGALPAKLPPDIRDTFRNALGASYNASAKAPLRTGSQAPRTPANIRAAFQRAAHEIGGGILFGPSPDSARRAGQAVLDWQKSTHPAARAAAHRAALSAGRHGLEGSRKPSASRGHTVLYDELTGAPMGVTAAR